MATTSPTPSVDRYRDGELPAERQFKLDDPLKKFNEEKSDTAPVEPQQELDLPDLPPLQQPAPHDLRPAPASASSLPSHQATGLLGKRLRQILRQP